MHRLANAGRAGNTCGLVLPGHTCWLPETWVVPSTNGKGAFPAEPPGSLTLRECSTPSWHYRKELWRETPRLCVVPGSEIGVSPHPTELPMLGGKKCICKN